MFLKALIIVALISVLSLLATILASIFGSFLRWLYFGLGIWIWLAQLDLYYKIGTVTITVLIAYTMFKLNQKYINDNRALSNAPYVATVFLSAYFTGSLIGLIVFLIRMFL